MPDFSSIIKSTKSPSVQEQVLRPTTPMLLRASDVMSPSLPKEQPATFQITPETAADFVAIAGGSQAKQEMERITKMEVCSPLTPPEVDAISSQFVRADAYAEGFRLRRSQAEGLVNYLTYGGMFGQIGVGDGKTLLSLLICHFGLRAGKRPLLTIPSPVFQQLYSIDIRFARTKTVFDSPVFPFAGKSRKERNYLAKSGKRGIYICTHSLLSQPDAHEWLNELKPDLVVIDEAHNFANARAARTRRLVQTMASNVQVVALSGTMTKRSVMDYHHLLKLCLGENTPLPTQAGLAEEWGLVIDSGTEVDAARKAGPLTPLVRWAKQNFPDKVHLLSEDVAGFRRAFRLRKDSSPGVVSSDDTQIGCSLHINNRPFDGDETYPGFKDLLQKIDDVENLWLAPNGDEIEIALQKHKWLMELTAGFYNQLVWPEADKLAERRGISLTEAEHLIQDAEIAHQARNILSKEVRAWLGENARDGMDTPLLLMRSMAEHGAKHVTPVLYAAWTEWHALKKDEHPEREEKPVRVCDYKIQMAVKWAKEQLSLHKRGGIIWSHNKEINKWVYEEACKAGLDAEHCIASERVNALLANPDNHPKLKKKILCASIPSHGEGKNLQYMESMYLLQWDRSAKKMEQLLGRLHRQGQQADQVEVTTCNSLTWDDENAAACIVDSLYIHQTSGRQKLIYCSWEPIPKMYPPEALRQRGFENVLLDAAGRRALAERFGV